jgi:hypothetical protein
MRSAAGYTCVNISMEATGGPVNNRFCAIRAFSFFLGKTSKVDSRFYEGDKLEGKLSRKNPSGAQFVIRDTKKYSLRML